MTETGPAMQAAELLIPVRRGVCVPDLNADDARAIEEWAPGVAGGGLDGASRCNEA